MYIEVTYREAARILVRGGHVWDSAEGLPCTIELCSPKQWQKARRLRKLERKLRGPWASGPEKKWYTFQKV